jgi:hypothetical protein
MHWSVQSKYITIQTLIYIIFSPRPLAGRFKMNFSLDVTGCAEGTPVLYLEHVQVVATIRYGKRGDLKLTLYSPSGTESVLLPPRPQVNLTYNSFHNSMFSGFQSKRFP